MDLDDVQRMRDEAEQASWALSRDGIVGVGRDASGLVRVEVDHTDAVQRIEIGARWFSEIGPHGLADAVRQALDAAMEDRLSAWAERTEARSGAPVSSSGRIRIPSDVAAPDVSDQIAELRRTLTMLRQVRSELGEYRRLMQEQANRETVGNDREGRVAVTLSGKRITALTLSGRWLNTQPTGQSVADAIQAAVIAAYRTNAQRTAAAMASLPGIAAAHPGNVDPAALLRRLGLR
ncbi:hypothetical protein [Actinoplanes auranticolor]|uniref:YbaB/EbfC DNA-binding family protein n=1 Tax=Actinoplanes auranticolor TaxID=47988 RepID=A0A919VZV4_9ACTN|nr:hypothetical protein [Actinoplanes auranticolor]GIM80755.1 hypothetical protein Aau02nite_91960 [Actinoplanes auranticolor]